MNHFPRQWRRRRRGASMVRSLLVGASTLAILVVCFALYQQTQPAPEAEDSVAQRFPDTPQAPPDFGESTAVDGKPPTRVGEAAIGKGDRMRISLYDEDGTKSRAEVEFAGWSPVEGSPNEVAVEDPQVRLRTNSGHGVKVTARSGVLESRGGSIGSDFQVRRGRLIGDVVIEIDRLTEEERAELPPERRNLIDESQIIRIEADRLQFDRDYAKVVIDGPLRLTARDAEINTRNVELRFNESAGRIEYFRADAGGTIELVRAADDLGMSVPGLGAAGDEEHGLVDWLRATLEARIARQQRMEEEPVTAPEPKSGTRTAEAQPEADGPVEIGPDGIPIFRPGKVKKQKDPAREARRRITYLALFEGNINAQRFDGETLQSTLTADDLEILRDFSERDRGRLKASVAPDVESGAKAEAKPAPRERTVLTWENRLQLRAVEDKSPEGGTEPHIIAHGRPVRIEGDTAHAACGTLTVLPDWSDVTLEAVEGERAVLYSPGQGLIGGKRIHLKQENDRFDMHVDGPGYLSRADIDGMAPDVLAGRATATESAVEFATALDVAGRVVEQRQLSLTGAFTARTVRVIDEAHFTGRSVLREDDTALEADDLLVLFDKEARNGKQVLRRVEGEGDVHMTQGADSLRCDRIELDVATDEGGSPVPQRALALGNVEAVQGTRRITARERFEVDFAMVEREPEAFDPVRAWQAAKAAGRDPATIDWEECRRMHEAKPAKQQAAVRHLKAINDVRVDDASQGLNVIAYELDATVTAGESIETATIIGDGSIPAVAELDDVRIEGPRIELDMTAQRADVPGAGRLTLMSPPRDLRGREAERPIPVNIRWDERMSYRGDENWAEFVGGVNADSESTTTFGCDHLRLTMQDQGRPADEDSEPAADWWVLQPVVEQARKGRGNDAGSSFGRLNKELEQLVATGNAVAVTRQHFPNSEKLKTRARLEGPVIRVDLRVGVSRMIVDGAGNLMLEDFAADASPSPTSTPPREGYQLFEQSQSDGPSKTLITWQRQMWYELANQHAQFEGDVDLRHLSGMELEKRFPGARTADGALPDGRATFLQCATLGVDFRRRSEPTYGSESDGMGGLSASSLSQFEAKSNVQLSLMQRDTRLWLSSDVLAYDREGDLLSVLGGDAGPARIIRQPEGEQPQDISGRRLYVNTATGSVEVTAPMARGR